MWIIFRGFHPVLLSNRKAFLTIRGRPLQLSPKFTIISGFFFQNWEIFFARNADARPKNNRRKISSGRCWNYPNAAKSEFFRRWSAAGKGNIKRNCLKFKRKDFLMSALTKNFII